jgi:hypothetical protein
MRFVDIDLFEGLLLEYKVGRDLQHLEDLVFVDGEYGARKAVNYLREIAQGSATPSIKWDGSIAVYFGRNQKGEFSLMGKNAWTKGDWIASERDLHDYIRNSGKGEDWRTALAASMASMWTDLERAVPRNFRGFLFGDLLFNESSPAQEVNGRIEFTPNKVTYSADLSSKLGKRISNANLGIAVHQYVPEFGGEGQPVKSLDDVSSSQVFLIGETYSPKTPKIDLSKLANLKQHVDQYGSHIDEFLAPTPGLKTIAAIIYKFSNQMARSSGHTDMEKKFYEWIQSNVSQGQQSKILEKRQEHPEGSKWLFQLFEEIAAVKNDVIEQMDSAEQDLTAHIDGERGGEGYADPKNKVKLVPRAKWVAG